MRTLAFAVGSGLIVIAAACSAPFGGGLSGPTPQSVAVQKSDVPSGLQNCSESGEINSYLQKVKARSESTYAQVNDQWQKEKSAGATGGWVQVFADSADECTALSSGRSPQGSNPPKIVLNYVVQFKDEASASKDFSSEVLGLNPADIQRQGGTVVRGKGTGLGDNSTTGSISLFGLQLDFAVWQKKAFFVAVIAVGLSDAESKKIYNDINGRIS
jgi:hypothetical protein